MTPTTSTAASADQVNDDRGTDHSPNGVVIAHATTRTHAMTFTDAYRCWSGTTIVTAKA